MKTLAMVSILMIFITFLSAQTPADIVLKDGKTIHAYHFGQLDCDTKKPSNTFVMVKGKYEGIVTEIKEYSKYSKIELVDFTETPVKTGNNERGMVNMFKKNGISFTLDEAELTLSCYGAEEMYNQLMVQVINPVTEQPSELPIDTKDIQYIIFK